ncbi:AMP-dependent synthetase [Mesorhizobium sp. L-8-10]|uniref:AMP-binding protein n=1 Tax=Mesorhizobium sp. L-8-10 TaxID=2744523 RepID=UPI00192943A5|nr:AMP-binding protein [Mesorhizobium sp. L-8-10]BCH32343.1 AMP-dependent synthetase [Mesorhizobium sp. L-8-10]
MNIANWLFSSAKRHPIKAALMRGAEVVATYDQFARRAAHIARTLSQQHGLGAGDRVALFMTNRTEYLECLYAAWWIGGIVVPINAKLHAREAAWIVADSGARLVFVDEDHAEVLRAEIRAGAQILSIEDQEFSSPLASGDLSCPQERRSSDLAWLFYTSGTTGRPKGAMLTHENLVAMSLAYCADVDAVDEGDTALYAAPLSHGAGLYNFIHVRKAARHCVPLSGGFDADEILSIAKHVGTASMFAAPTMVRRLVDAAEASKSQGEGLKTVVYGGGPMYQADIERAIAVFGDKFVQIYGQGESPMTITALPRADHKLSEDPRERARLASVGRAHSPVDVRVVDSTGRTLAPGQDGEIVVSGPTVMAGYWNNPEASASTVRNGWLHTGDIGRLDAEGYLTLTDRSKDVIISGGSNVYPREVEEILLTHPSVSEVAVVGQEDAEWGELVVAFVVAKPDCEPNDEALDEHCLSGLARFKRPKRYVWLGSLPKNNYGKVLKTELRKLL